MKTFESFFEAFQFSKINNLSLDYFYLNNNISFKKHSNNFYMKEIHNYFNNNLNTNFESLNNFETKKINNLFELKNLFTLYDYVCFENTNLEKLFEKTAMIPFLETYEGNLFKLLINFKPPYLTEEIKKIEIYLKEKHFYKNNYPYLIYSYDFNNDFFLKLINYLENNQINQAFEFITGKNLNLDLKTINNLYILEEKNNQIIPKNLISTLKNKTIAYVGKNPIKGITNIYEYENENSKHNSFEKFNYIFKYENKKEENLYNIKNFAKLLKIKLNINEENNNIYKEILELCKIHIINHFDDKINLKWQTDLFYSNIEFKKNLIKAKKIIENIFQIIKKKPIINYKINDFHVDFYCFDEKIIIIDIFWNLPTIKEINSNLKYFEILNQFTNQNLNYYLIDCNQILKLENLNYELIFKKPKYNELFYWFNTCD